MTARVIDMAAWRAAHPRGRVVVRVAFDPLWWLRVWLSCWGMR